MVMEEQVHHMLASCGGEPKRKKEVCSAWLVEGLEKRMLRELSHKLSLHPELVLSAFPIARPSVWNGNVGIHGDGYVYGDPLEFSRQGMFAAGFPLSASTS